MLDKTLKSYKDSDGYTWHYYKCTLNERGYIVGFAACDDTPDEADIFEAAAKYNPELAKGCYKIVRNHVQYDEHEYNRILAEEQRQREEQAKEEQRMPAQVAYTAMMTDTELPEDE